MLTLISNGDIFQTKCQVITIPVNCVGVMGAGLALEMKQKFPKRYEHYLEVCKEGLAIGYPYLSTLPTEPPLMLFFPTKFHFKERSNIRDVIFGLNTLANHYGEMGIQSIAIPALGCGLGGLIWKDVKNAMEIILLKMKIPVEIYEPVIAKAK